MPVYPDYGELMTGGCKGFAKKTMVWPEDLIIGGIKRKNHKLLSAEAFQSVFLVASADDVFIRYKVHHNTISATKLIFGKLLHSQMLFSKKYDDNIHQKNAEFIFCMKE